MIFFGEIHVFLQLRFIGQFGANTAYLHNENYDLQEVFLSKTNSTLTWVQFARCCSFYHRWFSFLIEVQVFLPLSLIGLSWVTEAILHFENYDLRKYFIQKLSQFSQWHNVLDTPASNADAFLSRYMFVFNSAE
jgi:hypothetical protein